MESDFFVTNLLSYSVWFFSCCVWSMMSLFLSNDGLQEMVGSRFQVIMDTPNPHYCGFKG